MKRFVGIIVFVLCSSCGLGQIEVGEHSGSDGIWRGPSYGRYMSGTVYAVGVDYPDGYDWRADVEKESVRSSLVMFADGIPVLKLLIGDNSEISSDYSRHRLRDGCLYTDFTDGTATVLKKDGVEIARYEGEEEILCLEVYDGVAYTLSSPVHGTGFRFRADGNLILDKPEGIPFLHLDEYADSIRFFFTQTQKTASGPEVRYYQVTDGTVCKVEVDAEISKVWDIRTMKGRTSVVGTSADGRLVLVNEDGKEYLGDISGKDVVSCTFLDSECLSVCIRRRYSGDNLMSDIIWTGQGGVTMYRIGSTLSSILVDDEGCNAVINPANGREGIIFSGTTANAIPAGYGVCSKDCMVRRDSVLYVALSSTGCDRPVIWKDGTLDTLNINGPLTCLR